MKRDLFLTAALLTVSTTMFGGTSQAQTQQTSPTLDEVVVTATKRETTLADTALTVSVVDGAKITEQGIIEITDIFKDVPGIGQNTSPGNLPAIKIRGIGTTNAAQTLEQSVGLFLDGVYKPRARQYSDALFDVERVEVIKGAQGVVFGKNTNVGAVSVTARKPGDVASGNISASYETEFDSFIVQGGVDLPLNDALKLRVAGLVSETGGFVDNLLTGETDGTQDRITGRAILQLDPTPNFSGTFLIQHSSQETDGSLFQIVDDFDSPIAPFVGVDDTPFQRSVDGPTNIRGTEFPSDADSQDSTDVALTFNYDINENLRLTSITSYSEFVYNNSLDVLLSPSLPGLAGFISFDEDFDQITQEVRLDYQGDKTRILTGGFFQTQNLEFITQVGLDAVQPTMPSIPLPLGPGFVVDLAGFNAGGNFAATLDQDLTNFSGFIQITHDLTERLTIEGGLRVADENRTADFERRQLVEDNLGLSLLSIPNDFFIPVDDPARALISIGQFTTPDVLTLPDGVPNTNNDTSIDGAVTLSYKLSDDWLGHVSASQGTKSGAFNNMIQSSLPDLGFIIAPEVARTIEAGLKGNFAAGRGYLSAAAFYTDVNDFQESFFNEDIPPVGALVASNVDARSLGIEAEGRFALTNAITLKGTAAYLDAENTDNNTRLAVAPEFTTSWGVDYDDNISPDFALRAGAEAFTNSGFLHLPTLAGDDPIETGSFFLLDAYIGLTHTPSNITARLDVKNITNEVYTTFASPGIGFPIPSVQGTFNRPRTFRISLSTSF